MGTDIDEMEKIYIQIWRNVVLLLDSINSPAAELREMNLFFIDYISKQSFSDIIDIDLKYTHLTSLYFAAHPVSPT